MITFKVLIFTFISTRWLESGVLFLNVCHLKTTWYLTITVHVFQFSSNSLTTARHLYTNDMHAAHTSFCSISSRILVERVLNSAKVMCVVQPSLTKVYFHTDRKNMILTTIEGKEHTMVGESDCS
jgi:hypothetical protein